MNKRIKKKRLKQWNKDNVKVIYSMQPLDKETFPHLYGCCKLYAINKGIKA